MDGSMRRRTLRREGGLAAALSLCCGAALAGSASGADLATALEKTRTEGVPTVVIATSAGNPASKAYHRGVADSPWAKETRGLVQFVELPLETQAATARNLQVRATPTMLVYGTNAKGVACLGRREGGTAAEAVAWLESLAEADVPPADSGVARAAFDGFPSGQSPPQAAPPIMTAPAPVQQQPQAAPAQPMMMVPQAAPSTTQMLQMPSQNIVVQPGETRFFMAPAGSGAPAAAPMMGYAPQAAPAASPVGNLFLPAPAAAAPMASQPMGVAAAPTGVAAAPMGIAAVTNQTLSLPTSGSRTRVRVRGPGLLRMGLAGLGERMVQLGRSRIETIQETDLGTPMTQGTGAGLATFSSTSASPVAVPQAQQVVVVPQGPPTTTAPPEEDYPTASPQGGHKHGHFWKKH